MQELVRCIARELVDQREAVSVTAVAQGDITVLELRVAKEDLGKVIGKQGRTAKAMRVLLAAASKAADSSYRLEIIED